MQKFGKFIGKEKEYLECFLDTETFNNKNFLG